MQPGAAIFDTIRAAYGLAPGGEPRRISERVWRLPGAGASDGGVAVKLYADEHGARAAKEASILAHFECHGDPRFRVQALLRTRGGQPLWHGGGADGGGILHAMVTRWEAGRLRTYDSFAPLEWEALGASLGALHLSLERLRMSPGSPFDTIRARLCAIDADSVRRDLLDALRAGERAAADGGPDATKLRTYVDLALRLIDLHYPGSIEGFPESDPQHPIHNDYNQFNYLFGDSLPPVILDWEASIGAPREYELVRCLNHLPLEAPSHAQAFVRSYLRVRPVNAAHLHWAVDAACLQHALKRWVVRGWLADPARFDAHLDGAVTMSTMMLGARGSLIDFLFRCAEQPEC
ncbi:phosphotransferase enzyme family protein [Burkholderia glumae]|uniref:phosphotransferase enzyme family protein n=1 Tax=Burkholderia glumae TaxID=337 RepID=UPI001373810D|nr:phosphotransferase [Burkholderia glumae]MCR1770909.1 aminoglycoside phosphotransferase [Burkholderia glumae]QHP94048.1 aminoglycoside phosphotransferase [Burkholderia glumae]QKM49507.1 hypothetical protein B7760_03565 [Burkholderia glumae]UVS98278.1 aminoglycoside phosphotransferase [Burkholderia glumae]